MPARYRHDGCEHCVFLGQLDGEDVYFCPQHRMQTIIFRHGDQPEAYRSGAHLFAQLPPGWQSAARMAGWRP